MRNADMIDVGMVVLQYTMDLLKVERDSCSETYLTSADGIEVSDIKVENDTDIQDDYSKPTTFSTVKAECEVSCTYVCCVS
jgi:hypothetical protein